MEKQEEIDRLLKDLKSKRNLYPWGRRRPASPNKDKFYMRHTSKVEVWLLCGNPVPTGVIPPAATVDRRTCPARPPPHGAAAEYVTAPEVSASAGITRRAIPRRPSPSWRKLLGPVKRIAVRMGRDSELLLALMTLASFSPTWPPMRRISCAATDS
jgi:hypothetical protein